MANQLPLLDGGCLVSSNIVDIFLLQFCCLSFFSSFLNFFLSLYLADQPTLLYGGCLAPSNIVQIIFLQVFFFSFFLLQISFRLCIWPTSSLCWGSGQSHPCHSLSAPQTSFPHFSKLFQVSIFPISPFFKTFPS